MDNEVKDEKKIWDRYFKEALKGEGQEHQRNYWWLLSDLDTFKVCSKYLPTDKNLTILEAGCGSGGTSIELLSRHKIEKLTLFDISEYALEFAKKNTPEKFSDKVDYIQGSVLNMPFKDNCFDMVWNVGLIEHYRPEMIKTIVKEMFRVTKPGGVVIIAIPNIKSLAILKAALLGHPIGKIFLKFIRGYRNTTETLYPDFYIKNLIEKISLNPVSIDYVGSPLLVSTPDVVVKNLESIKLIKPFSFLSFFTSKKSSNYFDN